MRLLSVDWDFFFPVQRTGPGWDVRWGPLIESLWPIRARQFAVLPQTSGEEIGFWSRFRIRSNAKVYVADSHEWVVKALQGVTEVWSFDAHHDAGYRGTQSWRVMKNRGLVTAEDWVLYCLKVLHIPVHVWYPLWRQRNPEKIRPPKSVVVHYGIPDMKGIIGRVFICRSGAWVPPWLDRRFTAFVASLQRPVLYCHRIKERNEWKQLCNFRVFANFSHG